MNIVNKTLNGILHSPAPVGGGGGGGGGGVPSLNLSGLGGDGPGSRVRFKEPRLAVCLVKVCCRHV